MKPELLYREESVLLAIDFQEKLLPHIHDGERIVRRAGLAIFAAQTLGVPILATEQYPKGLGKTVPAIAGAVKPFEPIEKTCFSCAGEPRFAGTLAALGRRQVVMVGIETHVCIAQTALELAGQGKTVFIVVDACGSRRPLDAQVALKRLESSGIGITTAEALAFEWLRKAGGEEFKAISKRVKETA